MKEIPLLRLYQSVYPDAEVGEFAGWKTVITFTTLRKEHKAVREKAGIFDISHMTRTKISGSSATSDLQKIITVDVERLKRGRMKYGLILNDDAGIIDDVTVYKVDEESYLMVSNAATRRRVVEWVEQNSASDTYVEDFTDSSAFFAVQGPESPQQVSQVLGRDFSGLKWFGGDFVSFRGCQMLLTRSGYTGGDGFELVIPCGGYELYSDAWRMFVSRDVEPCGLACRDACRLEAGYLLSGVDFDESKTPADVGLMWAVNMDKKSFIGKEKLAEILKVKPSSATALLEMVEPGVPRTGYHILDKSGRRVGVVTSGGFVPSVGGVAWGFMSSELCQEGVEVFILVREIRRRARVRGQPFIKMLKP
ncbi:MAG: glycine cleavage system aminomethyltransferase GcvT [Candidatus Caldarchaeum sp.]|nr:glycine cleavage system aminomethyltransferase GcvT [Candidatus Caldarchaeum sp.]MDW8359869.1 glycine cleavage system aminomethyltransferase GcvT [Candidatus Caldarchaeum sp.]